MNLFQYRRYRQWVHHLVQESRHVIHVRGDLLESGQIEELRRRTEDLKQAWKRREPEAVEEAAETLSEYILRLNPPRRFAKVTEYVEIITVALAVAMGFRTYFIQPFKIPTGSMQPTLYGITVSQQFAPNWYDRFPLNLVPLALFGERYTEVRAKVSGQVGNEFANEEEHLVFYIQNVPHPVRKGLTLAFKPGELVAKGQVLASGRVRLGDHIFVNKIRYNFSRPRRGDITVFSTDGIRYPNIRPNSFYIKRMAGLPAETVGIEPPHLLVNGQKITEPYPFFRLLNDRDKGYVGYTLAREQAAVPVYLGSAGETRTLGEGEYLMLGDNTEHSYDGRYFGPVHKEDLVGPAFMVYWPFSKRWGRTR
ncbi:MAG: signal peptidase I [Kiritimatiellae bacterium]|nr:signal peptidase I [Kiritimatiellia bacterium]